MDLKNRLATLCSLLLLITPLLAQESDSTSLQAHWEQVSEQVERWVDQRGNPVDTKIKPLVIALNALNYSTIASSEGHLDSGKPYPWVDIEIDTPETQALQSELDQIQQQIIQRLGDKIDELSSISIQELADAIDDPELQELVDQFMGITTQLVDIYCNRASSLSDLIGQYQEQQPEERSFDFDRQLTLYIHKGKLRISCLGGFLQTWRSQDKQATTLQQYQEDMQAFANYLQQVYFSQ